ncbi:hypothetical protein M8C21_029424 [Ambrosia artemisiifolia]|uniref:MADS-box domain-containing protein n=1 Tax=Ambrosia artemisiifolia TaxID=4212 RepID=A0AAD5GJ78_AMBAR|nr:hypothetical protein M8C21_029424 [Ambrosia artemisiifolia]
MIEVSSQQVQALNSVKLKLSSSLITRANEGKHSVKEGFHMIACRYWPESAPRLPEKAAVRREREGEKKADQGGAGGGSSGGAAVSVTECPPNPGVIGEGGFPMVVSVVHDRGSVVVVEWWIADSDGGGVTVVTGQESGQGDGSRNGEQHGQPLGQLSQPATITNGFVFSYNIMSFLSHVIKEAGKTSLQFDYKTDSLVITVVLKRSNDNSAKERCLHNENWEGERSKSNGVTFCKRRNGLLKKAYELSVVCDAEGSAADIIKVAMIAIHSIVGDAVEKSKSGIEFAERFHMLNSRCRILLQVHDDLILEADPFVINEATMLLKLSMESAASLLAPLIVFTHLLLLYKTRESVEGSDDSCNKKPAQDNTSSHLSVRARFTIALLGLKVNLMKEVSSVLYSNPDSGTATPVDKSADSLTVCPLPLPPSVILTELKEAKSKLKRTTNDLAMIRASVESLNKKMRTHKANLAEKEVETKHVIEESIDVSNGSNKLAYEAQQFMKMEEAAQYEVIKATSEIEHTKLSIKMVEMRLIAAKKMEEAARAMEAVACAENNGGDKAMIREGITLSYEEYSELAQKAQKAEQVVKKNDYHMKDANLSTMGFLKNSVDQTNDVKFSRKTLEEALGPRTDAANGNNLDSENVSFPARSETNNHPKPRNSTPRRGYTPRRYELLITE